MSTCGCGCGAKAGVYAQTDRRKGQVAGEPRRYLPNHSKAKPHVGRGLPPAERRKVLLAAKSARYRVRNGIRPWEGATRTPEQNRAHTRAWKAAHPEKARAMARASEAARRARKRNQFVEPVDPQIVWERDEGVCGLCGKPADYADWHMDHVVPLARGGEHSYANTQVSHPACNLEKGCTGANRELQRLAV